MKILIIRFSSIGDIVLCTPVIRAYKLQLNAEVHLLTKNKFKDVISNNPYLDKIIHFKEKLKEIKTSLKEEQYDHIIDLHKNIRSGIVKYWLGKSTGNFPKLNLLKWQLVNFKINKLPKVHVVDRYFMASDQIKNDGKGLDYFIREENIVNLGIGPYTTLVLGATYYTKRIPKEILLKIIHKIEGQIVLIGGPEEKELGEAISAKFKKVTNACGLYKLDQSASIVNQSKVVIASDTGMMHIAAALKKPIIMVWGNTVPDFGMGPYLTDVSHFEVKNLSCRPCSKLGKDECPRGHFKCMLNQDVESMAQIANGIHGDLR